MHVWYVHSGFIDLWQPKAALELLELLVYVYAWQSLAHSPLGIVVSPLANIYETLNY